MNKIIYLIRHGETTSNVEKRIQGSDEILTERGRAQAELLAKRLSNYPIERIVTSTAHRAQETAAPLAAIHGLTPTCSSLFVERQHPTRIIGKHVDDPEVRAIHTEGRNHFHDPDFVYGDGEHFARFKERVLRAHNEILNMSETHIAVIAHGVFNSMFLAISQRGDALTSHELESCFNFRITNTGIGILHYGERRGWSKDEEGWTVLSWNDHAHLSPESFIAP